MSTTTEDRVLHVEDIKKYFRDDQGAEVKAVDGVSFEVQAGEFYTLLGPSGCGKTTTLRSVAGLESIIDGTIRLGNDILSRPKDGIELAPHQRKLGMVFQSYAIWPHMTVFQNVAFPLEIAKPKPSKSEIASRVKEALAAVELSGYEKRMATHLSGGQQQRLAFARALVGQPRLLLLDEPLSNLDAKLRESMRAELRRLQRRLGVTTLYVTHDQMEALSMSNRIAVMSSGKIIQEDSPQAIYRRPQSRFVAEFLGNSNFVPAVRTDTPVSDGLAEFRVGTIEGGLIQAPCPDGLPAGASVAIAVRHEAARMAEADAPTQPNSVTGTVSQIMFLGETVQYHVELGDGFEFLARAAGSFGAMKRQAKVQLILPARDCVVLSEEYGVATHADAFSDEDEPAAALG